jgi:citrate lyase subunit gamma (acyl carrier protein)
MKKIIKNASIGVEETNDMLVEVEPADPGSGVTLDFKTSVPYQYGDHLYHLILKTIEEAGYADLKMVVRDKGSWDYTVKARVLTVLERGSN